MRKGGQALAFTVTLTSFPPLSPFLVIGFPFLLRALPTAGCVTSSKSPHVSEHVSSIVRDGHRRHARGIGGAHRSAPGEVRGWERLRKEVVVWRGRQEGH